MFSIPPKEKKNFFCDNQKSNPIFAFTIALKVVVAVIEKEKLFKYKEAVPSKVFFFLFFIF